MRKGKMSTIRWKNKRKSGYINPLHIEKIVESEVEMNRPPRIRKKQDDKWIEL